MTQDTSTYYVWIGGSYDYGLDCPMDYILENLIEELRETQ